MNKKQYLIELERIERNSHSFLKYFGIFWGAILVFIVQNYGENSIAKTLGDQMVQFFANPTDLNFLGFGLLFIGVIMILSSLILLMATALGAVKGIENFPYQKRLNVLNEFLRKSVLLGILGSLSLLLLFLVSLMKTSQELAHNAILLGKIFFWIAFLAIFLFDPIFLLNKRRWRGVWAWVNAVISISIAILFILTNVFKLPPILLVILIFTFLIYAPIRLILSVWILPFFFSESVNQLFPKYNL
jgi:hypothetical protein